MAGRAAAGAIRGVEIPMPNASDFHDFNLPISFLPGLRFLQEIASRAAGGVGDIDAFCAIVEMPIAEVKLMLPAGLKLVTAGAATNHSVVLVFARQQNVRPGFLPFGGTSYFEIFQIIPDLALENVPYLQGTRFSFMPHLLLDQLAPVVVGKSLYGFNKQLAQIRASGDSFDVRGPTGQLGGHFNREGAPGDISKFPSIAGIRTKMEQPLVGIATDGSYICSIIDMHLDGATFQLSTGTIQNGPPFTPAPASLDIRNGPGHGPWGFHLRSHWSLSLPLPVTALKGQASARDARSLVAGYSQAMIGKFPFNRPR
jgi:Acetoacetate decarboxylase (ADC)